MEYIAILFCHYSVSFYVFIFDLFSSIIPLAFSKSQELLGNENTKKATLISKVAFFAFYLMAFSPVFCFYWLVSIYRLSLLIKITDTSKEVCFMA